MKIRKTQPTRNRYYIRTVSGGYNGAVKGYPVVKDANVLCNCVGYANGRFNEIIYDPDLKGKSHKFKYQLVCNAENFIESAKRQGLKISKEPTLGGIMVWQKGRTLSGGDGAGHVAVVEKINDDGTIVTSESGYGAYAFKLVKRSNKTGRWGQSEYYKFRGCIINPYVKQPKPYVPTKPYKGKLPKGAVAKGDKGADVKAVQTFLNWCIGTKLKVDGHCGDKTDKAIRKYQKKYGLTVDGSFGKKSLAKARAIIKKYAASAKPAETKKPSSTKKPASTKKPTTAKKELTKPQKAVQWAKKIAADNSYHYVVWGKDKRTHLCPICHGYKGWLKGFNCIRFVFSAWYHGGGIECKHEGGLINNAIGDKMLRVKSNAEALKLAQDAIGCKDIEVIRNKKGISQKSLKVGDACLHYEGNTYKHIYLYAGNGKMVDSGHWKNEDKQIAVRDALSCKVVVRYTGK